MDFWEIGISFFDEISDHFRIFHDWFALFVKSRDPIIFWNGISLMFLSQDIWEVFWDYSGIAFLMKLNKGGPN